MLLALVEDLFITIPTYQVMASIYFVSKFCQIAHFLFFFYILLWNLKMVVNALLQA